MAIDEYPREACGLLIGRRDGECGEVLEVRVGTNLERDRARDRFELDPADLLDGLRDARLAGLEVLGVWHSHPDRPARPSEADRAAAWPSWSYAIVSVSDDRVSELRAWRRVDDAFVEESIVTDPRTSNSRSHATVSFEESNP